MYCVLFYYYYSGIVNVYHYYSRKEEVKSSNVTVEKALLKPESPYEHLKW